MIKTVNDLIQALHKFDPDLPICIRQSDEYGYFSDWILHYPKEFYPGGRVCLSSFEVLLDEVDSEQT